MDKKIGVLLPVSSLPGRHGIGDFGEVSKKFIKWLNENGFSYWQILPLNPVGPAYSPYLTVSSKAIDIRYISLDYLTKEKLLKMTPSFKENSYKIDYKSIYKFKKAYLYEAYLNFIKVNQHVLDKFKKENEWVIEYAIYQILKEKNKGKPWGKWNKKDINFFSLNKLIPEQYIDRINFETFIQYIAKKQWLNILKFAHKNKINIIADVPFYVGYDSIDCWTNKEQFLIDENNNMIEVGGVPPDGFNEDGQLWGNPIYDFEKMKKDKYSFLIDRIAYLYKMCDYLRLDHFRAFDTYFTIKAGAINAKNGIWKIGPRTDFFNSLNKKCGHMNLIAEDLGVLCPSVYELKDEVKLPGMYIFQFGIFDKEKITDENTIVYTGTHDNETIKSWYKGLNVYEKTKLFEILDYPKNIYEGIFNYLISLPCKFVIFPLQDLLLLDNKARINFPGTISSKNWTWKMNSFNVLKKYSFDLKK